MPDAKDERLSTDLEALKAETLAKHGPEAWAVIEAAIRTDNRRLHHHDRKSTTGVRAGMEGRRVGTGKATGLGTLPPSGEPNLRERRDQLTVHLVELGRKRRCPICGALLLKGDEAASISVNGRITPQIACPGRCAGALLEQAKGRS